MTSIGARIDKEAQMRSVATLAGKRLPLRARGAAGSIARRWLSLRHVIAEVVIHMRQTIHSRGDRIHTAEIGIRRICPLGEVRSPRVTARGLPARAHPA